VGGCRIRVSKKERTAQAVRGNDMILVKINKTLTLDELEELVILTKMQETTDRYENTEIHIYGDKAEIDVKINECGDIELL
jgi:hypothetical protein